jgi:hypothetical protein
VELVALLPCAAALLAALWQAVGDDARRAALDHLPSSLEPGLEVETAAGGEVEVEVRIPTLPGLPSLGHTGATARFAPQS